MELTFTFGAAGVFLYWMLLYFSFISVSLWAGNKLLASQPSLPYRFAIGLITVVFSLFALEILGAVPGAGMAFDIIRIITWVVIVIIGIGAELYVVRDIYLQYRKAV